MAEETEKIYVIPLKKKNYVSSIAAPTAMKRVKHYLMKHMKVAMDDIWIDASLNQEVWKHGKYNMPNKLRVKAVKFDDGIVEVYLPELEFTKSRREILQDEKAKKTPILIYNLAKGGTIHLFGLHFFFFNQKSCPGLLLPSSLPTIHCRPPSRLPLLSLHCPASSLLLLPRPSPPSGQPTTRSFSSSSLFLLLVPTIIPFEPNTPPLCRLSPLIA